jgi:hypothetical protein
VVIPSAWSCHREPTSVGLLLRAIMTDVPPPPPKSPMIVILVIAVAGALFRFDTMPSSPILQA